MPLTEQEKDKIKGTIIGNAVGDAIGSGAEFRSKHEIMMKGGVKRYGDLRRGAFAPGEWTDDTAQMICIMDSLLDKGTIDLPDIASRFIHWARTDGRGMGNLTRTVLSSQDFRHNPHAAAKSAWERSGCKNAANGGVMRTAIMGCWDFWSPPDVRKNAETVCKVTHWDPRCIASCTAISLAIARMIDGKDPMDAGKEACLEAATIDSGLAKFAIASLEDLALDARESIGFTYKAAGAGLWALREASSFSGVLDIVNEGGDADTNAAVAGAILGAKFGLSGIPGDLVTGLVKGKELLLKADNLIHTLEERRDGKPAEITKEVSKVEVRVSWPDQRADTAQQEALSK